MSDIARPDSFPKGVLMGIGALMLFSIGVAATTRFSHQNHVTMPPTTALQTRDLAFRDLADGGIDITDANTGALITTVQPKTGGFVRGIMRGLIREHRLWDKPSGTSFCLTRWADGRLSIEDPATHESFELEAFGTTNEKVFAAFLEPRSPQTKQ